MASSSYFLLKIKYSNNSLVVIHWETSGKGATLITIQLYGASLQDRVTDRKPNHIPTDELKQGDHKQVRQRKHHKTPLFGKLKHCETLLMAEKWQQGRRNKLKKKKNKLEKHECYWIGIARFVQKCHVVLEAEAKLCTVTGLVGSGHSWRLTNSS